MSTPAESPESRLDTAAASAEEAAHTASVVTPAVTASTDAAPAAANPLAAWEGRNDGEGDEHARWHQRVRAAGSVGSLDPTEPAHEESHPHIGLLGFSSDEGVRRNRGRVGAADGPRALRRALSPFALHGDLASGALALLDHGDARTEGEDLEGGQERAAALITHALDAPGNRLTVVLGGGHETAWASYQGLAASSRLHTTEGRRPRWGVLNLDAHFDLRDEERPTSGTPFLQMARAEAALGHELHYGVIGIAEPSNTGVLFAKARELGVRWMTDIEALQGGAAAISAFIEDFARDLDVLYLTVDLDVLPAAAAPGVSAPAGLGVPLPLIAHAVQKAAATGVLALMDVVELNPSLDRDQCTARSAARLIDIAVTTVAAQTPSAS